MTQPDSVGSYVMSDMVACGLTQGPVAIHGVDLTLMSGFDAGESGPKPCRINRLQVGTSCAYSRV